MKRIAIAALVCSLIAAVAAAQPARPAGPPPAPAGVSEKRERIKKRIRALRAYTLTEELQLDEPTAAKLFPTLAKFDDEIDKLLLARSAVQGRLEQAHALSDAKAIDAVIDEALANQRALWDVEARRIAELRKILTPAQAARVLVVLPAMERRIHNQLRNAVRTQREQRDDEAMQNPFAPRRRATRPRPDDADHSPPARPRPNDAIKNPFDNPRPAKRDNMHDLLDL